MNEEKWLEIVDNMPAMGMTRVLATHCHFGYHEKGSLGLHLSTDDSYLLTKKTFKRLLITLAQR